MQLLSDSDVSVSINGRVWGKQTTNKYLKQCLLNKQKMRSCWLDKVSSRWQFLAVLQHESRRCSVRLMLGVGDGIRVQQPGTESYSTGMNNFKLERNDSILLPSCVRLVYYTWWCVVVAMQQPLKEKLNTRCQLVSRVWAGTTTILADRHPYISSIQICPDCCKWVGNFTFSAFIFSSLGRILLSLYPRRRRSIWLL